MLPRLCLYVYAERVALCCILMLMQIGQAFKPEHADTEYDRGKYMLKTLGLNVSVCGVGVGGF